MGKIDPTIIEARKALDVIQDVQARVVRRHHIVNAVNKLRHELEQLGVELKACQTRKADPNEYQYAVEDRIRRIRESMTARTQRIRDLVKEDELIKSWMPQLKKDIESAKAYLAEVFENLVERARSGSSDAKTALRKIDWHSGGFVLPVDLR